MLQLVENKKKYLIDREPKIIGIISWDIDRGDYIVFVGSLQKQYPLAESSKTLVGLTKIYSLPTNSKHKAFTEKTLDPISEERANLLKKDWGRFQIKRLTKIKGKIIDNKFVI